MAKVQISFLALAILLCTIVLAGCGGAPAAPAPQEPVVQPKGRPTLNKLYQPTWNSLRQHPNPQWLQDVKFGIFGIAELRLPHLTIPQILAIIHITGYVTGYILYCALIPI